MAKPIQIAVIGHTNTGKTSLLRTLTRRVNFGEVSENPGTTRNPQSSAFEIDGECVVRFWDTPGLEDSVSLHQYVKLFQHKDDSSAGWVNAFLKGPEASKSFEQEAKVLRKMLDVDAAIYVIDSRSGVLPKYECEIQILSACAKPIVPMLNFVGTAESQEAKWRHLLATNNMRAPVCFDVVTPSIGSERQLYDDLGKVVKDGKPQFRRVTEDIGRKARARRVSSSKLLADLLVSVTAMRREIPKVDLADKEQKADLVHEFKLDLVKAVRTCMVDLLKIHGFREEDAEVAVPTCESGRWDSDLLNPDVLLDAAKRLSTGATVGGAIGFAVDLALAFTTLGAASAIGASIGGLGSQGWGKLPHKLKNLFDGIEELTLEDDALIDLIGIVVRLVKALEVRGHAAMDKVAASSDLTPESAVQIKEVVKTLKPARSDPKWEREIGSSLPNNAKRKKVVGLVGKQLLGILRL